jgi:hypothetical protein
LHRILLATVLVAVTAGAAQAEPGKLWATYSMNAGIYIGGNYQVELRQAGGDWTAIRTQQKLEQGGPPLRISHHMFQTDSVSCPALAERLKELRTLQPLAPLSPEAMARIGGISDAPTYTIRLSSWPGEMAVPVAVVSGYEGTPVAGWVRATEAALKPCWRESQP